jgi:hypothetical protein
MQRIQDRIEDREPALNRLIAANRRDQQMACAGPGDIGDPDCFVLFMLLFFSGSFE